MGENNSYPKVTEINPNAHTRKQTEINPNVQRSDVQFGSEHEATEINPNVNSNSKLQLTSSYDRHLPVGTIVDGKYRITAQMASSGAEAVLHICTRENSTEELCLKLYSDSSHVRQEVRGALMEIDHRNIAKLIDWNYWDGRTYEVWRLYKGENLGTVIKQKRIAQSDIHYYLRQMDQALVELHRREIVHQDIKPDNFMITPDNTIVLIDFGISALGVNDGRTHVTKIGKTTAYASPEVRVSDFCWPASDYFSLGITLYEMMFGSTPYADYDEGMLIRLLEDMREVRISGLDQCTGPVRDLLVGLLQFEHSHRWGHDAIQAWLSGSYDAYMKTLNNNQSSPAITFTFNGTKYQLPQEIPQMVTAMAFRWNTGVYLLDEEGRFVLLREKLKNQDGMESLWAVCNEMRSDGDHNMAYFQKLYRLYPELKIFAWRGFVAEDSEALGKAILSALWQYEIRRETKDYFSGGFQNSFSDQPVELTFYWLEDLVRKHVIAQYLSHQKQTALYEQVLQLENEILRAEEQKKDSMTWYYRIGYVLSGSHELRFDGKQYKDLEDFISDVNDVISDCGSSGNNSQFFQLCQKIYNNGMMHPGFAAWAESLGYGDALETLKESLNRR